MRVPLGLMAFILVGAAGCGLPFDDSSGAPTCASVWVEDKTLPKPYGGCLKGSRLVKPTLVMDCRGSGGAVIWGFLKKNGFLAASPGEEIVFYEPELPPDPSRFNCNTP